MCMDEAMKKDITNSLYMYFLSIVVKIVLFNQLNAFCCYS